MHLPTSRLLLQRIETIDQPRDARKAEARQLGLPFSDDEFHRQAHRDDWRNILICGDNRLVMAALLEEFRGKIDPICIDPTFDVGADFTMQVQLDQLASIVRKGWRPCIAARTRSRPLSSSSRSSPPALSRRQLPRRCCLPTRPAHRLRGARARRRHRLRHSRLRQKRPRA
ncbi:MAG: hypothetical protein K6V36_10500 [Anaerolineae bacterium]|nr:hypothetical protein [Anaerolineae bacterium]